MKGIRRYVSCILITVFVLTLTGAGLSKNNPVLDLDKTPVYEKVDITSLTAYSDSYKDCDVIFGGVVAAKTEKDITVSAKEGSGSIRVIPAKNVSFSAVKEGDEVTVYGAFKLPDLLNKEIYVEAADVNTGALPSGEYYLPGKGALSRGERIKESVANGKVEYYVPRSWLAAKISGEDKDKVFNIASDAGSCYYINSIRGKKAAEALCIFYFDSETYVKYNSDYEETTAIERAIIENICPDEKSSLFILGTDLASSKFPAETADIGHGRSYDYYNVTYSNSHHVELVFTPVTGGICVVMYIYSKADSKEDLLFLLKTLETK